MARPTPGPWPSSDVGFVVPYDFALDRELWRWTPDDVSLYLTRTPFRETPVSVEQALHVGDPVVVAAATRAILTAEPGVVAYGCTSGSFVAGRAGERGIVEAMLAAGAPLAVTTSGALIRATGALRVSRIAVVTPYQPDVTALLVAFLAEHGLEVVSTHSMGLTGRIWTVPLEVTADLVRRAARGGGDAVFVSCTNLPTYGIIADLERELGVPVLTANQVTIWAALADIGASAVGDSLLLGVAPAEPPGELA